MLIVISFSRKQWTKESVQQVVDAYHRNDAYFPQLWTNTYMGQDGRVWDMFRKGFLDESDKTLKLPPDVVAYRGSEREGGD